MSRKYIRFLSNEEFKTIKLRVSDHFLQRWQERVEKNHDRKDIVEYIRHNAARNNIECDFNNFYIIDDEIVMVAKMRQGYIDLITVYGKISENPCLTNPRYLYETNKKYGKVGLTS